MDKNSDDEVNASVLYKQAINSSYHNLKGVKLKQNLTSDVLDKQLLYLSLCYWFVCLII